jgi:hypothetical protein
VGQGQTGEAIAENLAERLCWWVARRDDMHTARHLSRKPLVDGVYRLDKGALLDGFLHFLRAMSEVAPLEQVHGAADQREMVPFVRDCPALCGEDPVWD